MQGKQNQIHQRRHRAAESTGERGRSDPAGTARVPGLLGGGLDLPPSLSAIIFLNEVLFGETLRTKTGDRPEARAVSFSCKNEPGYPLTAALKANARVSLCRRTCPEDAARPPRALPLLGRQKGSGVHLKPCFPHRQGRGVRAGGTAGDLEWFAGLRCGWHSFAPALSGAG